MQYGVIFLLSHLYWWWHCCFETSPEAHIVLSLYHQNALLVNKAQQFCGWSVWPQTSSYKREPVVLGVNGMCRYSDDRETVVQSMIFILQTNETKERHRSALIVSFATNHLSILFQSLKWLFYFLVFIYIFSIIWFMYILFELVICVLQYIIL